MDYKLSPLQNYILDDFFKVEIFWLLKLKLKKNWPKEEFSKYLIQRDYFCRYKQYNE